MTNDLLRVAAVVAAVGIVAGANRQRLAGWASAAAKCAGGWWWQVAVVGLVAFALLGDRLPWVSKAADTDAKPVDAVSEALAGVSAADRKVWRDVWTKAAVVVEADGLTKAVAFKDTKALRDFTALAVDIAWRRIAGHKPGSVKGLADAVEAVYAEALGKDEVPVTAEIRTKYAAMARSLAR